MNESKLNVENPLTGERIDLIPFVKALMKRWWLILLAGVIFAAGFCFRVRMSFVPTYRASFTAYINSTIYMDDGIQRVTWSDISMARSLIPTFSAILSSKPVIEEAIEEAGLDKSYWEMASAVSVQSVNDTEIVRVSVVTTDPEVSFKMATALETAQAEYFAELVPGSAMNVLVPTEYPGGGSAPNYRNAGMRGFGLGAVLVIAILLLGQLLDNRVKSSDELEKRYGVVVVGTIHDLTASGTGKYGSYYYRKRED